MRSKELAQQLKAKPPYCSMRLGSSWSHGWLNTLMARLE